MIEWWNRRGRRTRTWLSITGAIASALAGGYLILAQLWPWLQVTALIIVAVLTTGVIAVASTVARALRTSRSEKDEHLHRKIIDLLHSMNHTVVEMLGDDGSLELLRDLGASAWKIDGPGRRPYLRRIGRVRISSLLQPSGITWTKGKGVLGECWQIGRTKKCSPAADDARLVHIQDADAWNRLPEATRHGLTFEEYTRIRGKYGTVIAVPIRAEGTEQLVGVVTLDAPPGKGYHPLLDQEGVEEIVASTAKIIRDLIT